MSKFVKFIGMPSKVMGGNGNASYVIGNSMNGVKFLGQTDEGQMVTYLYITDEIGFDEMFGSNKYVEDIDSLEAINAEIESINYDEYKKENEGLMNANINYLVDKGSINFDSIAVEMTEQEELEYLYSKGCSGISKKRKYKSITL